MKSLKKNFLSLLLTFIIAIQLMPLRVWAAQDILGENDIDEYTIEDRNGSALPVTTECPDVTPPETTCETVPDKLEDIDQIGESYEEGGDEYET